MSGQLEEQLAAVPERWREATRSRAYAVMDYVAAGADASRLVDMLCRRTGLTRSSLYALVRRWKATDGNVAALVPWARKPNSGPRIRDDVTSLVDGRIAPFIEQDPDRPAEPVVLKVLDGWPDRLPKPGISYVRGRVAHVRAGHPPASPRRAASSVTPGGRPEPRWPLDVLLVDHIAMEAVVWEDDEPTLPIATVVIDLASREPLGASIGLEAPGPASVRAALSRVAAMAASGAAPGPPTIVLSTAFARGWPELVEALRGTGAAVLARRAARLRFGSDANRLLEGRLDAFRLAPRLGHRPPGERVTRDAAHDLPGALMEELDRRIRTHVGTRLSELIAKRGWPVSATADRTTWGQLSAVADEDGGASD